MSFSKVLITAAILLFATIGVIGWMKKNHQNTIFSKDTISKIVKKNEKKTIQTNFEQDKNLKASFEEKEKTLQQSSNSLTEKKTPTQSDDLRKNSSLLNSTTFALKIPSIDRVKDLFDTGPSKLSSIVETVTYKSKVPWIQGRPAWIADWASHYSTSRHFIARSLNGKPDYFTQDVSDGDQFNVLRKDINLSFYLIVDLSTCKLYFWAYNEDDNDRILLKIYDVGVGRLDDKKTSNCLTPLGKYMIGSKVVTYKPGSMGLFQGQSIEMIKVFGTRWMPFDKEIEGCTEKAKGFGLHGVPWVEDNSNQLVENLSCISKHESDGCIRLSTFDIEELYSIIITKPTTVEIVKNLNDASIKQNEIK
jgi:lipoprotein-anchoring transpeptidase ErfK/SrfK